MRKLPDEIYWNNLLEILMKNFYLKYGKTHIGIGIEVQKILMKTKSDDLM